MRRRDGRMRLRPEGGGGRKGGGFLGRVDHVLEKLGVLKAAKLETLLQQTVSRLAILKNQRRLRCAHGKTDIAQLLQNGKQDIAILRSMHVIREQNMLDVFEMVQDYCNLLTEKRAVLKHKKECPSELGEAVSSLVFMSSRCSELPELDDMRSLFTAKFGRNFVMAADELHSGCRVNADLIEKMSIEDPSMESRLKLVKSIALERRIRVSLEEPTPEHFSEIVKEEEKQRGNMLLIQPTPPNSGHSSSPEVAVPGSEKKTQKHKSTTTKAIQLDLEAAITAVMDLARAESHANDSKNQSTASPSEAKTQKSQAGALEHGEQLEASGHGSTLSSPESRKESTPEAGKLTGGARHEHGRSLKGWGSDEVTLIDTYDADTEEDACPKSKKLFEARKRKGQGHSFRARRRSLASLDEEPKFESAAAQFNGSTYRKMR